MILLRSQPRRADRCARAHGPVPVPPVIPLIVAHIADDGAMRVALDGKPHEPQAFAPPWMRHHLVSLVNDIIGERNSPVRVIIHEADGTEYDDIVAEPIEAEVPLVAAEPVLEPRHRSESGVTVSSDEGFLDGEEVAVAVIVRHVRALPDGSVQADVDPVVLGTPDEPEILLFGRSSSTCAVRRVS
jgi:hypothetical protein